MSREVDDNAAFGYKTNWGIRQEHWDEVQAQIGALWDEWEKSE